MCLKAWVLVLRAPMSARRRLQLGGSPQMLKNKVVIAIRRPDPQKHKVFQHFSESRSTVLQLSMVIFQNHQYLL